jgi:hypothetical protein
VRLFHSGKALGQNPCAFLDGLPRPSLRPSSNAKMSTKRNAFAEIRILSSSSSLLLLALTKAILVSIAHSRGFREHGLRISDRPGPIPSERANSRFSEWCDVVARLHACRKVDFRKAKRLAKNDGLFVWINPGSRPKFSPPQNGTCCRPKPPSALSASLRLCAASAAAVLLW